MAGSSASTGTDAHDPGLHTRKDNTMTLTTRIQIPAYTDRFMMGDSYGNIVKTEVIPPKKLGVGRYKKFAFSDHVEIAHVLLDKSNKVVKVILADCTVL